MSFAKLSLPIITILLELNNLQCREIACVINGRKCLNVIDERFISFSVDPAYFLRGFNISEKCLKLAQNLNPALIRIAGPSTEFLELSTGAPAPSVVNNATTLVVTPLMWESLNYWVKNTNLTPVFAINDKDPLGRWEPDSLLPFVRISDRMNLTYYWQLGYDSACKSGAKYREDLEKLRSFLEDSASSQAKVVGSNLRPCFAGASEEAVLERLEELDADALMWEDTGRNPTYLRKSPVPIWLATPKSARPVAFGDGLAWAKEIGEAAKDGYEVVFRQPRFHELFTDTSVYWISLLFKSLMGRNVLEVRTNALSDFDINIYAHCTKVQDDSSKQGSMTVFIVNNDTCEHSAALRVANSHPKSVEVQSYIVTSHGENSTTTFLNGQELIFEKFTGRIKFSPKLRRVRINKVLSLSVPAKTVAFFVFPAARLPVCIKTNQFPMEDEFENDQNIDFSEEESSPSPQESLRSLYDLYKRLKEEMEIDQRYYHHAKKAPKNFREGRGEKPAKLEIVFTERPSNESSRLKHVKTIELELTNEEVKKILHDRAKSRVFENNLDVTSNEVANIMTETAEENLSNSTANKRKRFVGGARRTYLRGTNKKRAKRDINMDLLRRKVEKGTRQATMRKFGQTSRELLTEVDDSPETNFEVYAGLSKEPEPAFPKRHPQSVSFHYNLHPLNAIKNPVRTNEDQKYGVTKYVDERIQFLMGPSADASFEDDLKSYHSFQESFKYENKILPEPALPKKRMEMERISRNSENSIPNNDIPLDNRKSVPTEIPRLKRELSKIGKDDIKAYKKFMLEQLRVMRRAHSGSNKLRLGENQKTAAPPNFPQAAPQEFPTKKEGKKRERKEKFSRRKRNAQDEESAAASYRPQISGMKKWKPEDLAELKKNPSYSVEILDNSEFLQRKAPVVQSTFVKRRDREIDSKENEIEDFSFVDIQGNRKFFKDYFTSPSNDSETEGILSTTPIIKTMKDKGGPTPAIAQSAEEDGDHELTERLMNAIMGAVNTTISGFVHLSERLASLGFSF